MQGPLPDGSFSQISERTHWEESRLVRGKRYRVTKAFVDSDGDLHPQGEEWVFVASIFSPYDDEMLIGVRLTSGEEWQFILRTRLRDQNQVKQNFLQYVTPIDSASDMGVPV
jgi:hypothetical protein